MKAGELLFHGELALRLGHPEYTIAAARQVVEALPGHLRAHLLLGQGLLERGLLAEAAGEFQGVLELDPENVVARSALAVVLENQGQLKGAIAQMERAWESGPSKADIEEALAVLRAKLERVPTEMALPAAGVGRLLARKGQHAKALYAYQRALSATPQRLEVRLAQAESLWRMGRLEEGARICQELLSEASQAVKAKLLLGLIRIQRGDQAGGTALMHEALSADPSGSVAATLLESTNFVLPTLEESVDIPPPGLPLPPEVEAALAAGVGLKGLPEVDAEEVTRPLALEEAGEDRRVAHDFQEAVFRLSQRLAPLPAVESQVEPALGLYHIVTRWSALRERYGEKGAQAIERKLKALQEALAQAGYDARLLILEGDEEGEPGEVVKAHIIDMEASHGGEDGGHVLLVGGDEVLPFHRLANPTEDDDLFLLSDTPYSGAQNLFLSRRAVGRLPDGGSGDPRFLLSLLDDMITSHISPESGNGSRPGLLGLLLGRREQRQGKSFGYTALVWRAAIESLYQLMGDPRSIQVSPPITDKSVEPGWMDRARFLLFNLHGTQESRYWYGQKDGTYPLDYPLFPIALSPDNLSQVELRGAIVFTEACYGANILGKSPQDSLALQFLRRGAACVVGATGIAYGAGEPPLIAADLLARYFWLYLSEGMTAGESLSRARTRFLQEAQSRQGYIDGDDQKTALEFILLGDPAARLPVPRQEASPSKGRASLGKVAVEAASLEPRFFCKRMSAERGVRVEGEMLARARTYLRRVAPEAWDTQLSVLPRHCCPSGSFFQCQGECHHQEVLPVGSYLVTAQKSLNAQDGASLRRVARLTMDQEGRVTKVCISK